MSERSVGFSPRVIVANGWHDLREAMVVANVYNAPIHLRLTHNTCLLSRVLSRSEPPNSARRFNANLALR